MRTMNDDSRDSIDLNELTPQILATLSDRDFRLVVSADLRKDASNQKIRGYVPEWISEALRNEHMARRLATLQAMLANVDGQLDMRKDKLELAKLDISTEQEERAVVGAYLRDSAGPKRFRSALLEAMPEAEYLVNNRVVILERAIRAHRKATKGDPKLSVSVADEALWAMLSD